MTDVLQILHESVTQLFGEMVRQFADGVTINRNCIILQISVKQKNNSGVKVCS